MISEVLYIDIRDGLRSSERLRTHIVVGDDSGRVVLVQSESRSRQLVHRRDYMPVAFALAMLPCQTSTCLIQKQILLCRSRQLLPARSHAASLWPWPCSSIRSAMSPVLQAHEFWADHVNSSAGEIPGLLLGSGGALRPDAQRRRSYMRVFYETVRTCWLFFHLSRSTCFGLSGGSGWVFLLPESPKRSRIRSLQSSVGTVSVSSAEARRAELALCACLSEFLEVQVREREFPAGRFAGRHLSSRLQNVLLCRSRPL